MDPSTLDNLARALGSGQSRRRILKTLAGGAVGAIALAIGFDDASAVARKRSLGQACSKNADCYSAACLPRNHTGQRVCGCGSPQECPAAGGSCQIAACSVGVCSTPPAAGGTPCPTGVCDGSGTCVQCRNAGDCPPPSDLCHQTTCIANICGSTAVGDDQPGACPGGQVCCGGTCANTSSDANHCGSCAKICRATDSCQRGVCSGPGTCPAGSDFCATGNPVSCDGSSSCHCYGATSGALFCGTAPAVCGDCNVDVNCAGFGAGWACVDLGTHCSTCGSSTPTHVCIGPCTA